MSCSSCSTLRDREAAQSKYLAAMAAVQKFVQKKGIPREKIFYYFQLSSAKSRRLGEGGARGGYTSCSEAWDLPNGYRLVAVKHYPAGEIIPLKKGETLASLFTPGGRLKEEYYHEPRLEPFFDTLEVLDAKGNSVASLKASYWNERRE